MLGGLGGERVENILGGKGERCYKGGRGKRSSGVKGGTDIIRGGRVGERS